MTRFRYNQSSFALGEISEEASARTSVEEFAQSAKRIENYNVTKTAGLKKRPGTRFHREISEFSGVLPGSGGPALIPFIVSKTISYVIAIKNTNVIPTGATTTHSIQIYKNNAASERIGVDTGSIFFSYPNAIASLTDPRGYSYAQSADQMFIAHESGFIPPIVVTRIGTDSFSIAEISAAVTTLTLGFNISSSQRFPYRKNVTPLTLTPNATSATTITANDTIFETGHIGARLKITHGTTTGIAKITSLVGPSPSAVVNVDMQFTAGAGVPIINVELSFGAITASDNWHITAWNGVDGYPSSVAIYEGRAVWGGTITEPGKLFFSLAGNLFHLMEERLEQDKGSTTDVSGLNYFGDVQETDPFSMELGNKEANQVTWIDSGTVLQVGTLGAEYVVTDSNEGAFSILTARRRVQSSYGSRKGKVARVADRILFISRTGKQLRDYKFNRKNSSYRSNDLTVLHNEIHKHGTISSKDNFFINDELVDLAYQGISDIVWVITSKNDLIALGISDETGLNAWSRHVIAGDDVNVWGVCSVPNPDGDFDDIYLTIDRDVDGVRKFYLEKLGQNFNENTLDATATIGSSTIDSARFETQTPIFLDSHYREIIAAGPVTSISGLGHLEGADVVVTHNGTRVPATFNVAAGAISGLPTLETGDIVIVGLLYEGKIILQDPEIGGNYGDAKGSKKSIDRVDLNISKTYGLTIGREDGKFESTVKFDSVEVESTIKRVQLQSSPGETINIVVKSAEPYPSNILNAVLRGITYD